MGKIKPVVLDGEVQIFQALPINSTKEFIMRISEKTHENMIHMTGLSYKRKPFRNYYNSGYQKLESLDVLVSKELATVRNVGEQNGGYYYHLTKKGFKYMLDRPSIFDIDKRIKKLETLWDKAHR